MAEPTPHDTLDRVRRAPATLVLAVAFAAASSCRREHRWAPQAAPSGSGAAISREGSGPPGIARPTRERPAGPTAAPLIPTNMLAPATRIADRIAAASDGRRAPIALHVIIISEDGLRPDALVRANGSMHAALMREGSFSLKARTIRHASTLPSHAAMLSGFDEPAHKLSWNSWQPERGYIQVPTIFDAAENAGRGAAAFVGKQKLEHIAHPGSVDVFARPGFLCKRVAEEAARYFVDKRPQVEFVHFSDPDEEGHAIGWMSEPQMQAIRHADRCLTTLVEAVKAAGLAGDTLFILSADHGGHGRNHSGRIEEDRLIPWIAWGPGVRHSHRILAPISTMDTAATALWALGYPQPPHIEGRPVLEAFDD